MSQRERAGGGLRSAAQRMRREGHLLDPVNDPARLCASEAVYLTQVGASVKHSVKNKSVRSVGGRFAKAARASKQLSSPFVWMTSRALENAVGHPPSELPLAHARGATARSEPYVGYRTLSSLGMIAPAGEPGPARRGSLPSGECDAPPAKLVSSGGRGERLGRIDSAKLGDRERSESFGAV